MASRGAESTAPPGGGEIPVYHVTAADAADGRSGRETPLERHMDEEVSRALWDWDLGVRSSRQSSLHVRSHPDPDIMDSEPRPRSGSERGGTSPWRSSKNAGDGRVGQAVSRRHHSDDDRIMRGQGARKIMADTGGLGPRDAASTPGPGRISGRSTPARGASGDFGTHGALRPELLSNRNGVSARDHEKGVSGSTGRSRRDVIPDCASAHDTNSSSLAANGGHGDDTEDRSFRRAGTSERAAKECLNNHSGRHILKENNLIGAMSPRRSSAQNGGEKSGKVQSHRHQTPSSEHMDSAASTMSTLEFPDIDIVHREETRLNASTDSMESLETARGHHFTICPATGRRIFHVEFDMNGFTEENISVKVIGLRLVVNAMRSEGVDQRKRITEFCRKVKLPDDVNLHELQCHLADGRLLVQAPVTAHGDYHGQTSCSTMTATGESNYSNSGRFMAPTHDLNVPQYITTASGQELLLLVEIGRLFRAEDVCVTITRQSKIIINANREETQPHGLLRASLIREIDLEHKIVAEDLKAGIDGGGILRVTAQVVQDDATVPATQPVYEKVKVTIEPPDDADGYT